jgi:transcription initiation factor TFIIIB Brf1 subunit/transcription initiation factor TFIIB
MYYYIIDLVTTNKSHAGISIFSKKERKQYVDEYKSHLNIDTEISSMAKSILKVFKERKKERKKKYLFSKN